jgi:S1/P1 Nuclease.
LPDAAARLWLIRTAESFGTDAPGNKRTALRFVAHLFGDIHQPLQSFWLSLEF